MDEDALDTTSVHRRTDATNVAVLLDAAGAVDVSIAFSAWVAGGVTINVTQTTSGGAYLLTVMLFGGGDLDAKAGIFTPATTIPGATTISPGFGPNLVFFGTAACGIPAGNANYRYSFGVAAYNDAENVIWQNGYGWGSSNGVGTSACYGRIDDDRVIGQIGTGGAWDWSARVTDFFASSIRVETLTGSTGSDKVGYLALRTGSLRAWTGVITTPDATGNQSYTACDFIPQWVLLGLTELTAVNTASTTVDSHGVGSFDEADNQFCAAVASGDGLAVSNTWSICDDQAVNHDYDNAGTAADGVDATFTSMAAPGWNMNFSNVTLTSRKYLAAAIEAASVYQSSSTSISTLSSVTSPSSASALSNVSSLSSSSSSQTGIIPESKDLSGFSMPPPPGPEMLPRGLSTGRSAGTIRRTGVDFCVYRWQIIPGTGQYGWARVRRGDPQCRVGPPTDPGRFPGQVYYRSCGQTGEST